MPEDFVKNEPEEPAGVPKDRQVLLLVTGTLVLVLLYGSALSSPDLLDEHFLKSYLVRPGNLEGVSALSLLDFQGPTFGDSWGQLSTLGTAFWVGLTGKSQVLSRLPGLIMHLGVTVATLVAAAALLRPLPVPWLPIFMALAFLVCPLSAEPVLYLGARGYLLGLLFLVISLALYVRSREKQSFTILGIGTVIYGLAILSDRTLWPLSFNFISYYFCGLLLTDKPIFHRDKKEAALDLAEAEELEDAVDRLLALEAGKEKQEEDKSEKSPAETVPAHDTKSDPNQDDIKDLFQSLFPALPFVVVAAAACLASLPASPTKQLPREMLVTGSDWLNMATVLFEPAFGTWSWLFLLPLLAVPFALKKSWDFRRQAVFLTIWLFMALVPHMHQSIEGPALAGSRFLYQACMPACGLISLLFLSPLYIAPGAKSGLLTATRAVVIVLFSLFLLGCRDRLDGRIQAFARGAEQAGWLRQAVAGQPAGAILVRGLDPALAVASGLDSNSLALIDQRTGLLRAPCVIESRLGEASPPAFRFASESGPKTLEKETIDSKSESGSTTLSLTAPPVKAGVMAETFFDFPCDNEMGMAALYSEAARVDLSFDFSAVEGAEEALLEISRAGVPFENPNGNTLSRRSSFRTIKLTTRPGEPHGKVRIGARDLRHRGVFYLRAFAVSKNGNILGRSSDAVAILASPELALPESIK
ncbi:MAG: hypothetical protein KC777_12055 [Cyanobacteria bacterium HKST-UBA02]|nr:hypothetical protein [Cyanobacteria bacterium HKST-UBA02]